MRLDNLLDRAARIQRLRHRGSGVVCGVQNRFPGAEEALTLFGEQRIRGGLSGMGGIGGGRC